MSEGDNHEGTQHHKQRSQQEPRRAEVEEEQHEQHVHQGHAHLTGVTKDGRGDGEERGHGAKGEGTAQPGHVGHHNYHCHSPSRWAHGC